MPLIVIGSGESIAVLALVFYRGIRLDSDTVGKGTRLESDTYRVMHELNE